MPHERLIVSPGPTNVVVTGGGTIAPIDDVRLLTNVSSGRFAAAITEACLEAQRHGLAHPHTPCPAPLHALGQFYSTAPTPPPSSIAWRDSGRSGKVWATVCISSVFRPEPSPTISKA